MLLQRMSRIGARAPLVQLLPIRSPLGLNPRALPQSARSFSAIPGPEDQWNLKKVAKGPIPPMLLLFGIAMWMNRSKNWDGSPRMSNVSIKIFGANMPI
mmetsp:Transcript_34214/g.54779  ORF Transcript_34214/g.54779 Transcript_34214/m.54779 type:complete len:99 (+) Transcript_34214:65-361(+)